MDIRNIQTAQSLFRALDGKSHFRKGNTSSESNPSPSEVNSSKAQENTLSDRSNLAKGQVSELATYDPPFFPLGKTQLMDSIEGPKLFKEEKGASSSVSAEAQKEINRRGHAKPREAVSVLQQGASDGARLIKNNRPEIKHADHKVQHSDHPGKVLDLKI